jgi:hypothetical protein
MDYNHEYICKMKQTVLYELVLSYKVCNHCDASGTSVPILVHPTVQ